MEKQEESGCLRMNESPVISVVMPVYNVSLYLREAMESILNQTFGDFEFIIINDGSTDNSEEIIRSYTDSRIVYLKNEKNSGLIHTLNRGIDKARGQYIARMDGDDISLPERFEKQVTFFRNNPSASVLATTISIINEKGEIIGYWKDDKRKITAKQIKAFLPVNNCISHPTVMIKAELLKKFRYNISQHLSEDYDLWLRLAVNNVLIYKLEQPLIYYRYLNSSFTRTTGKNLFFKLARVKWRFVCERFREKKVNFFVIKTGFYAFIYVLKGIGKHIKRKLM